MLLFIIHFGWVLPDWINLAMGGAHPPIPIMLLSTIPSTLVNFMSSSRPTNRDPSLSEIEKIDAIARMYISMRQVFGNQFPMLFLLKKK